MRGHMGNHHHKHKHHHNPPQQQQQQQQRFTPIRDKYECIEQVQQALRDAGLESSNLVLGIDYTISNVDAGKKTFGGHSLHALHLSFLNPYQQVMTIIGKTLQVFDDDNLIPCYGFGDKTTGANSVFPLFADKMCVGFEQVLMRYNEVTPNVKFAGPTSFAPIIREGIRIVKESRAYHILVIIADGQVTPDSQFCQASSETRKAIVEASYYPLSIILVGVGDGPWEEMNEFDDQLPERKFDNFQFVEFHRVMSYSNQPAQQEADFALHALQEIPDQYQAIKRLGYLDY